MENLFSDIEEENRKSVATLAGRMRPQSLGDIVGQEHIIGENSWLYNAIQNDNLSSIILFGPAGTGKTSIARVIANTTNSHFVEVSAIGGTVSDLRREIQNAKELVEKYKKKTILFVDEIHRFNRAQQDALLHAVEDNIVTLIGATTENPYFEVNTALNSRSHIIQLNSLNDENIAELVKRAMKDERGLAGKYKIDDEAMDAICVLCGGDGRVALNILELASNISKNNSGKNINKISLENVQSATPNRSMPYDKNKDMHYDIISAFIKSMRGSDPDAATYWCLRMLDGGEDPKFVARRIFILASEDIGNADPQAICVAAAAFKAVEVIGMPECKINLVQAATYMAMAPKSNAVIEAIGEAEREIKHGPVRNVPNHLRDRHRPGSEDYGDYKYPHSYPGAWVDQQYLPDGLEGAKFYNPTERGWEAYRQDIRNKRGKYKGYDMNLASAKINLLRKMTCALTAILSVAIAVNLIFAIPAQACTGVYVGKDASAEGTTIIARSEDEHPANSIDVISVTERVENQSGRIYEAVNNNFKYKLPDTTYKYFSTPADSRRSTGQWGAGCTNEYGLAITGTVTGYISPDIAKADPYVEDGLHEEFGANICAMTCQTARECVERLGQIIKDFGNAQSNIFMFADQNEAWYMETYCGHQWAAIKLPADKIAVFGNQFMLQTEYDENNTYSFLHSPDLFTIPQNAGLSVTKNGKMSLCETYAGKDRLSDYANYRTYVGHYRLAQSSAGAYNTKTRYDLLYSPDKKVNLDQIFALYRERFEGMAMSPEETGYDKARVIGTETQSTVHAIQVFDNVPAELANVSWASLANAEHSVFLPYSNLLTKIANNYKDSSQSYVLDENNNPVINADRLAKVTKKKDIADEEEGSSKVEDMLYNEDQAHCIFKRLCTYAEQDRAQYGQGVRDFWNAKESSLLKDFPNTYQQMVDMYKSSPDKARDFINDYTTNLQIETLAEASSMYDELIAYTTEYTDTLKHKFDYKTLTYAPDVTHNPPYKASMTFKNKYLQKYNNIEQKVKDMQLQPVIFIGIAAGALVIIAGILLLLKSRKKNNIK